MIRIGSNFVLDNYSIIKDSKSECKTLDKREQFVLRFKNMLVIERNYNQFTFSYPNAQKTARTRLSITIDFEEFAMFRLVHVFYKFSDNIVFRDSFRQDRDTYKSKELYSYFSSPMCDSTIQVGMRNHKYKIMYNGSEILSNVYVFFLGKIGVLFSQNFELLMIVLIKSKTGSEVHLDGIFDVATPKMLGVLLQFDIPFMRSISQT